MLRFTDSEKHDQSPLELVEAINFLESNKAVICAVWFRIQIGSLNKVQHELDNCYAQIQFIGTCDLAIK